MMCAEHTAGYYRTQSAVLQWSPSSQHSHNALPGILRETCPQKPAARNEAFGEDITGHQIIALSKLAGDNIPPRRPVGSLDSDNSQQCRNLYLCSDLSHLLLDNMDIDVMTNAEIADHIALLKFTLARESMRVTVQNDKIQQLQNELIRKNDFEKKMLQLYRTRKRQQQFPSQISGMRDPEARIYQQGKPAGEDYHQTWNMSMIRAAENSQLSAELEKMQKRVVAIQQPAQLEHDSKHWRRERENFLSKLSDYAHDFASRSTIPQ